jgi:2-isopropylmalate synthase
LIELYKKCIAHGAEMVSAIDTFGVSAPPFMRYLVSEIKKAVGDVPINVHAHNDFGLAVANSVAAVEGGATWIQSTVNGLGDRGGNASFEVVATLELLYGVDTGIKMSELYPISKFVEKVGGLKCQPHKAIVGENAWFEESHAAFLIPLRDQGLNMLMAESYKPEIVGQKHKVVIGKTALKREFLEYTLRKLNLNVTPENIEAITDATVKEVEKRAERGEPRYVSEEEFYALCKATAK